MNVPPTCPACGADQSDGKTCEEHFHQMLFWESEYPEHTLSVHHLIVASYHIQHPHLYSPEGLAFSIGLLGEFLTGIDPQEKGRQMRASVQSGTRAFKVTARPDAYGSYPQPIAWTMFARDVTAQPIEHYAKTVQAWAASIYAALSQAGLTTT